MKISDIIRSKNITLSCEVFPPKAWNELAHAKETVGRIAELKPDFMSVTYGATGGTRDTTVSVAAHVQEHGVTALAHLTCVGTDDVLLPKTLSELKAAGVENVLALRGDLPADPSFVLHKGLEHANDLAKKIKEYGDFCVGGACYPEGHPESASLEKDIETLKYKVDAGCEFLTTQMFFDNDILYSFMYKLLKKQINVPVIAGIMPVTNAKQVKRITGISGNTLPPRYRMIAEKFEDDPGAMKQAGIAFACEQIIDLIANGVRNIHIYTMNSPDVAGSIMSNLSEIVK